MDGLSPKLQAITTIWPDRWQRDLRPLHRDIAAQQASERTDRGPHRVESGAFLCNGSKPQRAYRQETGMSLLETHRSPSPDRISSNRGFVLAWDARQVFQKQAEGLFEQLAR